MASKFFSSTQQAFSIGFGSSMTIVTTAHRYKPPPRKREAVAIAVPANDLDQAYVVQQGGRA